LSTANVIKHLCNLNQKNRLEMSYQDSTYTLKTPSITEWTLEVNNFLPTITEEFAATIEDEFKVRSVVQNRPEASLLAHAHANHFTCKFPQGKLDVIDHKPINPKMSAINGLNKKMIANPALLAFNNIVFEENLYLANAEAVSLTCCEIFSLQADDPAMAKWSKMLNQTYKELDINNELEFSLDQLETRMRELAPAATRWSKLIGCGDPAIGSNLKIIPPLVFLAGKREPSQLEKATYMGAAGLVHMRAVRNYFDVVGRCYDLIPSIVKEEDPVKGAYHIEMQNFFNFDYTGVDILIEDVFDKSTHKKDKTDSGLHKKASALLRFEIYYEVRVAEKQVSENSMISYKQARGREFKFKKVMIKARLPNAAEMNWYDDAYPFIACKTSNFSSTELYLVKYYDEAEMKRNFSEVRRAFKEESETLHHYCAYIGSRESYTAFVKVMYAISNCTMFLVNQSGVVNFTKELVVPYPRDWKISSNEMPNCYVSKKNRTMGTVSLKAISEFSDYIEKEEKDSISAAYQDIQEEYDSMVGNGGSPHVEPGEYEPDDDFKVSFSNLKTTRGGKPSNFKQGRVVRNPVEHKGKQWKEKPKEETEEGKLEGKQEEVPDQETKE